MKNDNYQHHFSEEGFWLKLQQFAAKAGRVVLDKALTLYYAALDADTPAWARASMFGVLGYFITPLDAIPDITPAAGFTDDLSLMVAALVTVAAYIKAEHKAKANEKLQQWFPEPAVIDIR